MKYECQSCYSSFNENDIGENSLGDPQCPECGSFDLVESDPDELFGDDTLNSRDDSEDPEEGLKFTLEE